MILENNIGISWDACGAGELSFEEQAEFYHKYEITNTFLDSERDDFHTLTEKILKADITIDTLHAPFNGYLNINTMWLPGDDGENMLGRLTDGVDKCSEYDIPVLIVHLSSGDNCPHINDLGYERFTRLYEYSVKKNVKLAFENQRKTANLAFALEQFQNAGFCWDCGHEGCFAYGRQFMPIFGDRVCALHLHDNYGVHNGDEHMIPYDADLDFDRIARQLAAVNYDGTIMLEIMRHKSGKYENITAEEYFERAAKAVRKLRDTVVSNKK